MTLGRFVRRSLAHRRLATALSALSVALGVGLVVGIDALRREVRDHFGRAAESWDLVVGPKGDPLALVLHSVFYMGKPSDTLPEAAYHALRRDPRVRRAVPQVMGDLYRGHPVVGTSEEMFGLRLREGAEVRCAAGRPFAPFGEAGHGEEGEEGHGEEGGEDHGGEGRAWEAVLGAAVAREAGHGVGDTFLATHGLDPAAAGKEHDEAPWTVVGILEPTGTPLDRVVLVPYEAVYAMEGHDPTARRGKEGGRRLSSIIVETGNPAITSMLFFQIQATDDLLPAYPFVEIRRLFDLVGNGDRILLAVSVLVVIVAALGILVSMTNSMSERRRDIAMMRALGAPRRVVGGLVVGEAAAVGLLGAAGGLLLGHGILAFAAARLTEWTGVAIRGLAFHPAEALVVGGAVLLCALAGLVPAAAAYRVDVARGLE